MARRKHKRKKKSHKGMVQVCRWVPAKHKRKKRSRRRKK